MMTILQLLPLLNFCFHQSPSQVEKVILQAIRANASISDSDDALRVLFHPHLEHLAENPQLVDIIKTKLRFNKHAPLDMVMGGGMQASNNWVVSGEYTKSGKPMLACDPHLALSMPSTFAEHLFKFDGTGNYMFGIGLPGSLATVMGRSKYTAFGFT